jgi:type IV pilus assembly PilP-like protein
MQGLGRHSIALTLACGLGLAMGPSSVAAAPGEGALRGPVEAIAKARAAAQQAERRAEQHDAQAATTVDTHAAPRANDTAPAGPAATGPAPADATGDHGSDQAPANGGEQQAAANQAPYDPAAHRDPFRPPRLNGAAQAKTPLETYQLGQLKLVGVVAQSSEGYRAMVEDSAGLGYIITTGTPIGSSGGVVRSIEPRRVVIEESTRDYYGDVKSKEVVMELPQEDRSP